MSEIIRTERTSVLWAPEPAFGTMTTPYARFGIHDTVTAPDAEYKWVPFFGVGSVSRNRDTILRGPQEFRGSVPDIRLQGNAFNITLLQQILGRAQAPSFIFEGITATDGRIPSMTMQIGYRDTSNTAVLVRNFVGGKINRATLSASEGEELRLSLEEIMFLKELHNRSGVFGYDASVVPATDPGISDSGRFIFAGAQLIAFGMTLARVRRMSISIDNQLEYRYYLKSDNTDPYKLQRPNDIVEGKRVYKAELELDLGDPSTDLTMFNYLLSEGAPSTNSKTVGTPLAFVFQCQPSEGSATLVFNCSATPTSIHPGAVITSGKHNIPAPPAGLIPVTLSIDFDSMYIGWSL